MNKPRYTPPTNASQPFEMEWLRLSAALDNAHEKPYVIRSGYAYRWHRDPPDKPMRFANGHMPNLPGHIRSLGQTPRQYLIADESVGVKGKLGPYDIEAYPAKPGIDGSHTESPMVVMVISTPTLDIYMVTDQHSVQNVSAHDDGVRHFAEMIASDVEQYG